MLASRYAGGLEEDTILRPGALVGQLLSFGGTGGWLGGGGDSRVLFEAFSSFTPRNGDLGL